MTRVGMVGLGKMGLSHYAILNAHPRVEMVGICDASSYVLGVLGKYTGTPTFSNFDRMLGEAELEAVVIATPTSSHVQLARAALEQGLDVFCEKPLTLSAADTELLTGLGGERERVTQVGYHNRFVAAFGEAKSLLEAGAIGEVTHVLGEAYGPVVLKAKGKTWRSQRDAGGSCLYDYAAHVIDLLAWYLGEPEGVGGTVLNSVFSRDTDDEVYSTLYFCHGKTAQLSVNWSDESYRKMTTRITLWGTAGRIYVDRQECQAYLRDTAVIPAGYEQGWNVRYTTDLTEPVGFYLRGEEYSAQIDSFVRRVEERRLEGINRFEDAATTDRVIGMMLVDAAKGAATATGGGEGEPPRVTRPKRPGFWRRRRR